MRGLPCAGGGGGGGCCARAWGAGEECAPRRRHRCPQAAPTRPPTPTRTHARTHPLTHPPTHPHTHPRTHPRCPGESSASSHSCTPATSTSFEWTKPSWVRQAGGAVGTQQGKHACMHACMQAGMQHTRAGISSLDAARPLVLAACHPALPPSAPCCRCCAPGWQVGRAGGARRGGLGRLSHLG